MNGIFRSTEKIIIVFLILSAIWLISSDYLLLHAVGSDTYLYSYLQIFKDLAFIGLVAFLIYYIFKKSKHASTALIPDENMETILSGINACISCFSPDGIFIYTNKAFCSITGYTAEELTGKHYNTIIKGENNTELEYWESLLKQGKLTNMNNLVGITSKNKGVIICNAFVNRLQKKDNSFIYSFSIEDISQKIAGDKALEENLTRYTILGKSAVDGLWDWNMLTGQLYYNANMKMMFGYADSDLQNGLEWWKSNIHPDDKEKILDKIEAAFKLRNITNLNNEYRFACKDGSYKVIVDSFSIMRNAEGMPFRLIVSMQDFTEQRNLQKQLVEKEVVYRRQLARTVMDTQESERRKLAEELHDNVNQLLGVVKLYIEHSITNENVRDGLLRKSSEYIDKVIEELRNLSKNLSPPLLAELGLEHSVNSLAEVISSVQHITVTIDMMDFNEEGLTESHKLMLYRIIQEQLNNIIKHAHAQNVQVGIRKIDKTVQLTISDDGKGTDLSTETGMGLGLRNIRNRIELYHGNIDMITSPGNGFVLKVEFEV